MKNVIQTVKTRVATPDWSKIRKGTFMKIKPPEGFSYIYLGSLKVANNLG